MMPGAHPAAHCGVSSTPDDPPCTPPAPWLAARLPALHLPPAWGQWGLHPTRSLCGQQTDEERGLGASAWCSCRLSARPVLRPATHLPHGVPSSRGSPSWRACLLTGRVSWGVSPPHCITVVPFRLRALPPHAPA